MRNPYFDDDPGKRVKDHNIRASLLNVEFLNWKYVASTTDGIRTWTCSERETASTSLSIHSDK